MGAVTRPPTALDLFCGCGGIAAGLRSAGFHILAGVDVEPHYMSTFSHNFPEARGVLGDLSGIDPLRFMRGLSLEAGDLDLLAGGPPCQGFSKNVPRSRRSAEDRNNGLMRTFLRYAEVLRPRAVMMENVAEMRNGFDRAYTDEVLGRLERAGYAVAHETLNAADYGVPQRRRRAFFVGLSSGRAFAFPERTHFAESPRLSGFGDPHVTVWDAIGDLPSVDHASEQRLHRYRHRPFTDYQRQARRGSETVTNHRPRRLRPLQYERLASLQPGQGIKDLPERLRPRSGYSGAYGRLTRDMVAPTITRWVFHPGSGRFGHPEDIRVLTIREAARLQGFADVFEFTGSYNRQAAQVGNAVPPVLAGKLGAAILGALSGCRPGPSC